WRAKILEAGTRLGYLYLHEQKLGEIEFRPEGVWLRLKRLFKFRARLPEVALLGVDRPAQVERIGDAGFDFVSLIELLQRARKIAPCVACSRLAQKPDILRPGREGRLRGHGDILLLLPLLLAKWRHRRQ